MKKLSNLLFASLIAGSSFSQNDSIPMTSENTIFLSSGVSKIKEVNFNIGFLNKPYTNWFGKKKLGVENPNVVVDATKKDFFDALKNDTLKYVVLFGHGTYQSWEASDSMVTETDIAKAVLEDSTLLNSKEGLFKYTCGQISKMDSSSYDYENFSNLKNDSSLILGKGAFFQSQGSYKDLLDSEIYDKDRLQNAFLESSKIKENAPLGSAIFNTVYNYPGKIVDFRNFNKNPFPSPYVRKLQNRKN